MAAASGPGLQAYAWAVRLTAIVVACGSVAVTVYFVAAAGLALGDPRTVLVIAAAGLCVAAIALVRSPAGTWCAFAALISITLTGLLTPAGGVQIADLTTVFVLADLGVLVLPRKAGLVWIAAMVALWSIILPDAPVAIDIGGSTLDVRWIQAVQLAVAALWLWSIVDGMLDGIRRRDAELARSRAARREAVAYRERMRVWRASAVRTHETVLNDLRYVLSTESPARDQLAQHLAERDETLMPEPPTRPSLASVVEAMASVEQLQGRLQYSGDDVALDADVAEALRAGIVEVIRNATRHASATAFAVRGQRGTTSTLVAVRHNGRPAGPSTGAEGLGRRVVLRDSLEEAGIALLSDPRGADFIVRSSATGEAEEPVGTPDNARLVLSTITAGNALGGALFAVVLVLAGNPAIWAAMGAFLITVALATLATARRAALPVLAMVTMAAMAAASPLLSAYGATCGTAPVAQIVVILTGYAVIAGLLWAPTPHWWWLAAAWVAGLVGWLLAVPDRCAPFGPQAFSAVVPMLAFAVSSVTLRRTERRAAALRALADAESREVAAAAATRDLAADLSGAIEQANTTLASIASGSAVDETTLRRLRCLDSEIRAALQVDPETAGGMSMAARALVIATARADIPVKVMSLADSGDRRSLDGDVVGRLRELLLASAPVGPTVNVISVGDRDMMTLSVPRSAIAQSDIATIGGDAGLSVEVAEAVGDGMAVIILQREAQPAALPAS